MTGNTTWRPRDTHGKLSEAKERALPDSAFAFPKQRKGPLTGAAYVREAIGGFREFEGVTDEDRDLARFLRSTDLSPSADPSPGEADALLGIADRIEGGIGDYPTLLSTTAGLANGHDGSERERAVYASKTVIRPLASGNGRDDPASPA